MLSPGDYVHLAGDLAAGCLLNSIEWEERRCGACTLSVADIKRRVGLTRAQYRRAVELLIDMGLVDREKRAVPGGGSVLVLRSTREGHVPGTDRDEVADEAHRRASAWARTRRSTAEVRRARRAPQGTSSDVRRGAHRPYRDLKEEDMAAKAAEAREVSMGDGDQDDGVPAPKVKRERGGTLADVIARAARPPGAKSTQARTPVGAVMVSVADAWGAGGRHMPVWGVRERAQAKRVLARAPDGVDGLACVGAACADWPGFCRRARDLMGAPPGPDLPAVGWMLRWSDALWPSREPGADAASDTNITTTAEEGHGIPTLDDVLGSGS